jgi:MFS family permease
LKRFARLPFLTMYSVDWAGLLARHAPYSAPSEFSSGKTATLRLRLRRLYPAGVSRTVWYLGLTSFFTDVSSEMVSSILPMFLVLHLQLTPLAFGIVDGIYQGFAAFARVAGGFVADRWRSYKAIASAGYGLSAFCKLGLLAAGNVWSLLALTIAVDRVGKGIRTAPRDALISFSSPHARLASAFGVHRALDAAGAMLGPLAAFLLLAYRPSRFDVVFVVSFCIAMVGFGVIVFFVNAPPRDAVEPDNAADRRTALGLLRMPAFYRLLIAGGMLGVVTISDSFLFLVLQRQLQFKAAYFPLLYVGVAACHCVLAIPGGRAADRFGRRLTFLAGHVLLLIAYGLLITPDLNAVRLIGALVLCGAYYATTDGVLAALASAAVPAALRGSGLALLASVTSGARFLASVLFGAAWFWAGPTNAVMLFAGGLAAAVVTSYAVVVRDSEHA